MKQRNTTNFTSANFHVIQWTTNRPDGVLHHATIYPAGAASDFEPVTGRQKWYDRTWESFRYESATLRAIEKLPARYRAQARAELIDARKESERAAAADSVQRFADAFHSMPANCQRAAQGLTVNTPEEAERLTGIFSAIGFICGGGKA